MRPRCGSPSSAYPRLPGRRCSGGNSLESTKEVTSSLLNPISVGKYSVVGDTGCRFRGYLFPIN
jgi:hypothetical protein